MKAVVQIESSDGCSVGSEPSVGSHERPPVLRDYEATLFERIRKVCEGLACSEIGRLTGTNHETSRRYVRGQSVPPAEFLARLSVALKVPAGWLLLGEDDHARRAWSED